MPRKIARSGRQTPFGLAEALMAVHTSYLSCGKAGKPPIFAPVRESSGESQMESRYRPECRMRGRVLCHWPSETNRQSEEFRIRSGSACTGRLRELPGQMPNSASEARSQAPL